MGRRGRGEVFSECFKTLLTEKPPNSWNGTSGARGSCRATFRSLRRPRAFRASRSRPRRPRRLHEDSISLRLRRWLGLGRGLLGRGLLFFRLRSCGVGSEQRNQNCAHDDASLSAPLHDNPLHFGSPHAPLLAFCSTGAGESSCAALPLFLIPEQLDGHSAIRLGIEISEPPLALRTFPAATLRDGSAF